MSSEESDDTPGQVRSCHAAPNQDALFNGAIVGIQEFDASIAEARAIPLHEHETAGRELRAETIEAA